MLGKNHLKEKLLSGKAVLGTWCIIPSPITVDIIASTGLDFLIIDAEHGPIGYETAQNMVMACESRGVSPVMRVGEVNESAILRALDIGVHCVQIPNIFQKQQVKNLVHYAKFPPIGNRGFSPFTRAAAYTKDNANLHATTANNNTLVAINVEGKEAIENIDELLEVEGLDILFIGLFDLSKVLGIPGDTSNPKVISYLDNLTQKINKAGKYPGTITTSPESIDQFLDMGLKYIVHLADCEMLYASYRDVNKVFRKKVDNDTK
jgi:4-hydroxy-2-oxoheptanedioate aldolase